MKAPGSGDFCLEVFLLYYKEQPVKGKKKQSNSIEPQMPCSVAFFTCILKKFSDLVNILQSSRLQSFWSLLEFSPFLAPGTGFVEDNFSTDWGEVDSFMMILVHYIQQVLFSVITTSASPQLIRHQIPKVKGSCSRWHQIGV